MFWVTTDDAARRTPGHAGRGPGRTCPEKKMLRSCRIISHRQSRWAFLVFAAQSCSFRKTARKDKILAEQRGPSVDFFSQRPNVDLLEQDDACNRQPLFPLSMPLGHDLDETRQSRTGETHRGADKTPPYGKEEQPRRTRLFQP